MQRSLKNKFKDVKSEDWSATFGFYAVGLQILHLYKENFHLFSELKGDIFWMTIFILFAWRPQKCKTWWKRVLTVADGQQDVTLRSAPRGTTSGPCISLGKGGLLSGRRHSAMHRAQKGHLQCPTACGLSLLCQVPVFLHVFFVCLGLRLPGGESTSAQRRAPQQPPCTWVFRSKIKQLQTVTLSFFGNFVLKFWF